MSPYKLCGKIITDAEHYEQLLEILSAAADLMANAEGCYAYVVCKIEGDDTAIWVDELWESQEAHDKSLFTEGVGELIQQARPLIRGMEQFKLQAVRGKGSRLP